MLVSFQEKNQSEMLCKAAAVLTKAQCFCQEHRHLKAIRVNLLELTHTVSLTWEAVIPLLGPGYIQLILQKVSSSGQELCHCCQQPANHVKKQCLCKGPIHSHFTFRGTLSKLSVPSTGRGAAAIGLDSHASLCHFFGTSHPRQAVLSNSEEEECFMNCTIRSSFQNRIHEKYWSLLKLVWGPVRVLPVRVCPFAPLSSQNHQQVVMPSANALKSLMQLFLFQVRCPVNTTSNTTLHGFLERLTDLSQMIMMQNPVH